MLEKQRLSAELEINNRERMIQKLNFKLDREQSMKLDRVLAAFGNADNLDKEKILEIFDGDEKFAHGMVTLLVNMGLVTEMGKTENHDLPMFLQKRPEAILFNRNEGFEKKFEEAAQNNKADSALADLQKHNLELQNENLGYQRTIREQEARIRAYDEQNKLIELLKNYWWLLGIIYALGLFTIRLIHLF